MGAEARSRRDKPRKVRAGGRTRRPHRQGAPLGALGGRPPQPRRRWARAGGSGGGGSDGHPPWYGDGAHDLRTPPPPRSPSGVDGDGGVHGEGEGEGPGLDLDWDSVPTPIEPTMTVPEIMSILDSVTDHDVLYNHQTPQNRAMAWLMDDVSLSHAYDDATYRRGRTVQRYALATTFFATAGGGGEGGSWFDATGWLTEASECDWKGVRCGGTGGGRDRRRLTTPRLRSTTGDRGRGGGEDAAVVREEAKVAGTRSEEGEETSVDGRRWGDSLPDEDGGGSPPRRTAAEVVVVADESHVGDREEGLDGMAGAEVTLLDLANNGLAGTLPREMGSLDFLVQLHLFGNEIRGTVPDSIADLADLRESLDRRFWRSVPCTFLDGRNML